MKKFLIGLICGLLISVTTVVYATEVLNVSIIDATYLFDGQEKNLMMQIMSLRM